MNAQQSRAGYAILTAISIALVLFHAAMILQLPTWWGYFVPRQSVMAVSLAVGAGLIILEDALERGASAARSGVVTGAYALLWICLAFSCGFVIFRHETILDYGFLGTVDRLGVAVALTLTVPVLVLATRKVGWPVVAIVLFFCAVATFQQFLPGVLHGRARPPERLLFSILVGDAGVFGKPLQIAVYIVIVFLVFGALMERAGASRWFMDMALAMTGRARGGPAKAAVVASAMFGSISGSPSGNSATTGVFTIPMMKRVGYRPTFAAAVEAVASSGGMILPPVMGAIAFLMAEWIEVRYADVVAAAAIPAVLFFVIVFASVHFEARKSGIRALDPSEVPGLWRSFVSGWRFLIPVAVLVWLLLVRAVAPGMAGIYAAASVIAVSFLTRDRTLWLTPVRIADAFRNGVSRWLVVLSVTAAVGIMIGALEVSGVGINLSRFVVELGGGNLVLTLVLIGFASLIVGMGLDATPAYVTLAALMAPALIQIGVPPMAAHLFVIYWALASFFTPPTCLAVFVTAPIAGAPVWASGWEAVRLGMAAFIVPMAFAINPALLMQGSPAEIVLATATALAGALSLAAGLRGFALTPLGWLERAVMVVGGCLLIGPGWVAPAVGGGLACGVLLISVVLRPERGQSGGRAGGAGRKQET